MTHYFPDPTAPDLTNVALKSELPATVWYDTSSGDVSTWYRRWLNGGTLQSLEFDYTDTTDNTIVKHFNVITDFATGFAQDGFYGGLSKHFDFQSVAGKNNHVVICLYPDNSFVLNVFCNPDLWLQGKISNVKANGLLVDSSPLFRAFPLNFASNARVDALPIRAVKAVPINWKQAVDVPTVMPIDGIYRFVATGTVPAAASEVFWGFANAPAGSTVTRDGETSAFGGTNNAFTVWGSDAATVVREGDNFTVLTEGLRTYNNVRFSANPSASNVFSGSGEPLAGMRPSRWMAKNEGSIIWNNATNSTFTSIISVWNSTVHTPKTEYQITSVTYDGVVAVGTDIIPTGLHIASWRGGALSIQPVKMPGVTPIKHYSASIFRTDNTTITTAAGNPITMTAIRWQLNKGGYTDASTLVSGRFVAPIASRALVSGKWYNDQNADQRMTLRHSNSAGTIIRDYPGFLNTFARTGANSIVLDLAAGDRLEYIALTSVTPWYAQDHTELTVSSLN